MPNVDYQLTPCCREVQQMLGLVSPEDRPILPPTFRDAIFVCIDLEAFESAQDQITELGVSVLDTRDLAGAPSSSWLARLHYAFYRPVEHAHLVNRRFVKGCPDDFNFGPSTWIALSDAKRLLTRIFLDPTALARAADFTQAIAAPEPQRNVVFVAHGASNDVAYLRRLGFDFAADAPHVVRTVDSQAAAGGSKKHSIGLQRLLLALDLPAENLHNAGNDAAYTLQALVAMARAEHEDPGAVARGLARWKGKLPPAVYTRKEAPQQWGGSSTQSAHPVRAPSVNVRKHVGRSKDVRVEGQRKRKDAFRKFGKTTAGAEVAATQTEKKEGTLR
nr:putative nucleolar protein c2c4.08 [Quercus suber]